MRKWGWVGGVEGGGGVTAVARGGRGEGGGWGPVESELHMGCQCFCVGGAGWVWGRGGGEFTERESACSVFSSTASVVMDGRAERRAPEPDTEPASTPGGGGKGRGLPPPCTHPRPPARAREPVQGHVRRRHFFVHDTLTLTSFGRRPVENVSASPTCTPMATQKSRQPVVRRR